VYIKAEFVSEVNFNDWVESINKVNQTNSNSVFSTKSQPFNPLKHEVLGEAGLDKVNNYQNTNSEFNTIIVKNIPDNTTIKEIFKFFNCFGNVMKIKIFFSNPENALIEFEDAQQANLAKNLTNGCPFRGNSLFVSISKNPIIVNIPYIPEGHKYLADFKNSKEHRYRIAGSKNCRNIVRPSSVIHLSNLCDELEEDYYRKLFEGCGKIAKMFTLKGKGKSILVEMENVEDAVEVLVKFHNYSIEGKFLKVSFSKYQTIKF